MGEFPSIFGQFQECLRERPDEAAFLITSGDRSVPITWRQFARDVERIAWGVSKAIPGGAVGLLGENSYEWMVAHAGVMFGGGRAVPIDPNLSPDEMAARLAFVGAKSLVYSALHANKAHEVAKKLPDLVVAGFGSRSADLFMDKADKAFARGEKGVFSLPPPDEKRTAMIVFTSGTTSRPRGAELTLEGLAAWCRFTNRQLRIRPGSRSLMVLPLHHIFGVCAAYLMVGAGSSVGVCPDFRRLYDAVERFRAEYIFLVPALADILATKISQRGNSAEAALGFPIEWILVGGASLSMRVHENLLSLGIQPLAGYGLTETTALYSIAPLGRHKPGSAGQADLVESQVKVSPRGTLMIRGPGVFKGYYQEPERTAEVLKDGWFDTGDVGRIDDEGYVFITGRASRTIVLSSGKKIAPEEIEDKLLAIPGFREAIVSGNGETREIKAEIYAVVSEETVKRQVELLNRSLPVYQRIKTVIVRDEPFPRTSSGKIRLHSSEPIAAPDEQAGEQNSFGEKVHGTVQVVRRMCAKHPHRWRVSFLVLLVAMAVLVFNIVPRLMENAGIVLPSVLAKTLDFIGECGAILLALLVILGYFISRKLFPSEEE